MKLCKFVLSAVWGIWDSFMLIKCETKLRRNLEWIVSPYRLLFIMIHNKAYDL